MQIDLKKFAMGDIYDVIRRMPGNDASPSEDLSSDNINDGRVGATIRHNQVVEMIFNVVKCAKLLHKPN
jgi:hypothetical protein